MATKEQFKYLVNLRESGVTNMYMATSFLMGMFGLETKEAKAILFEWRDTFKERHDARDD